MNSVAPQLPEGLSDAAILALGDTDVVRLFGCLREDDTTPGLSPRSPFVQQWRLDLARKVEPPRVEVVQPGRFAHEPKVSVVVPVYNVRPYLEECLASVVSQTLADIEIICVDDGSTDGSSEILKAASLDDGRIVVLRQENHGLSQARNTGVAAATGRYLYFLDSDDVIKRDALQKLHDLADSHRLDVAYCDGEVMIDSDEAAERRSIDETYYLRAGDYADVEDGQRLFARMLNVGEYRTAVPLQLIRRDYFLANNLWFIPGILHEDEYFTLSAMALAKRVRHVAEPLFVRRVRGGSITTRATTFDNAYGYFVAARRLAQRFTIDNDKSVHGLIAGYIDRLLFRVRGQYVKLSKEQQSLVAALPQPEALLFRALIPEQRPDVSRASIVPRRTSVEARLNHLRALVRTALEPLVTGDCVLLNVPYHSNIGDTLIWQGELDLLAEIGVRPSYSASIEDFEPNRVSAGATILLQGGGNFGDLWRSNQDFRLSVIEAFPTNPIVMFPQSLSYSDPQILASDAAAFNRHGDLTLCWRDATSFAVAQRAFTRCRNLLLPDMALCVDVSGLQQWAVPAVPGSSVFVKRTDHEFRNGEPYGIVPRSAVISDWPTFDPPDPIWVRARQLARKDHAASGPYAESVLRPHNLEVGVKFLSAYETIYSTRLHAAILGILLGRNVRLFRNSYDKNQAVYEAWLADMDGLTFVRS